jgi:hypothetical protein
MVALLLGSCESFLEVDPPTSKVPGELIFTDDLMATSAMVGVYSSLYEISSFASGSSVGLASLTGLSGDELSNNLKAEQVYINFEENNIDPGNAYIYGLWTSMFKAIYQVNVLIEGISASSGMTSVVRNQLKGEALFVRAFCYFYLTNLFGDVPLVLGTDYKTNATLKRVSPREIYDQIKSDLDLSEDLVSNEYASTDRIRPNKSTVTALLSRVYLYNSDWARAEDKATNVIAETSLYSLPISLSDVFLARSSEAIWQLRPIDGAYYTYEGYFFSAMEGPKYNVLNDAVLDDFETGDRRWINWVKSIGQGASMLYLPDKYKRYQAGKDIADEYSMVIRLAEVYLNRAEARARQDKLAGAIEDVDVIRKRASLPLIQNTNPGIGKSDLLRVIEHERRIELLTEWGHRWFDLRRWGRSSEVLGPIKKGWTIEDTLYPIPQGELVRNRHLNPQNEGY